MICAIAKYPLLAADAVTDAYEGDGCGYAQGVRGAPRSPSERALRITGAG